MARNQLTDKEIRNAKPRVKGYRLPDGDRLFVWIAPTGGKSFQFRYKNVNGKGQTETLKQADTLAEARDEAERLRKIVDAGDDPRVLKRVARAIKVAGNAQTFRPIAAAWVKSEARRKGWSADYVAEVEQSLRNHLSDLDSLPVSEIFATITTPVLHSVEARAPAMEEKVSRRHHSIMDYAVELGAIAANPLPRRRRAKRNGKHYPAVTDLHRIGAILSAARARDPCKGIARAHLLLAFCVQRVSETVGASWSEFDLMAGDWIIPRERMKRKDKERGPHVIPIPPVLLAALREWRQIDGDDALYVCPAPRDAAQPITPEGIEKFYRNALDLAGKHSPHSWRSTFSTVCREAGKAGGVIEAQLDHVVGSKIASAYDRAARLDLRRKLLRWYERQLIAARDDAAVLPLKRRG